MPDWCPHRRKIPPSSIAARNEFAQIRVAGVSREGAKTELVTISDGLVATMKTEICRDQFGQQALARYKAALVEIDETVRQTKRTIEESQKLIGRLDRLIADERQVGYAAVTALEPRPEIIVIIPRHVTQFACAVIGLPHRDK